ncbi:MAG: chromosome segregation protein SMC [Clostridiales Family XIII bacterium]|nr:chromosome segregation protein SMC [Clostridiales Family XIII bacterium]
MYLKRIEIQGFKSFADPVTIEFHDGVTCIIGPNGSGKSNISDAMRWVLGEQSAKTLRGGKMEEIIFAGTDSRRSKGMAEVTLVLDNASGLLEIDYSEVAIKRRLYRSGESEYFINGNHCRLRDIRELIMDTGIGVDGYSFIGQGRVDKIVSDKPDMRREVFEEAAGIIKYKSKRAEAERKLESASGNLDRLNDIVIDIESRIDGLREESEKAREHAALSAQYRELEINITLKNIENLQGKNRELSEQFAEAGNRLETLRRAKAETDARLSAMRGRDMELEDRANGLRDRISDNVKRAMGLESASLVSEERRKGIEKDCVRLTAETEELARRMERENEAIGRLSAERSGFEEALQTLGSELAILLAAAADKESVYTEKVARIDELKAGMFELSRERSLKEAELSSGEGLFGSFDETEGVIGRELESGGAERDAMEKEIAAMRGSLTAFTEETAAFGKQAEDARASYDKTVSEIADKRIRVEAVRLQTEKQSSRKKTIEEMESNYEGYHAGVRALMKNKGAGLYGVTAELMKAEQGFETAIETALGATLQNIICESDADAKHAIGFLKENKAGRLTFLPVKSIRPRPIEKSKAMDQGDGFAGYALDRISYEPKYENVFKYLLGGVLIADTLDDAIALSAKNKEGWRIVTRDGEVVSPAGALTGGSLRNKSANLLERRNEIETLTREIEELKQNSGALETEMEALTLRSETYLTKIRESDAQLRGKDADRIRAEAGLKTAEYKLGELTSRIEKRRAELVGIARDRENSSGMIETLKAAVQTLTQRIDGSAADIEREMNGLADAKRESDLAAEAATEVRLRVAAANRDKENADAVLAAAERGAEDMRLQSEAKRRELQELFGAEAGVSEEEAEIALAALKEEKQELDADLETLVSERREIRLKIEETELAESRGADKIEAAISAKNGMEVELGRQDTRLTTWKEKLFDEFELSYVHALEFKKDDFVMSTGIKENRAIKDRIKEIGEVNPGSIREYEETSERYTFLTTQRDDVLASMKDFQDIVRDMDKISREKFRDCFDKVAETFSETFALLFGGGKGQILLDDENDPLESGIEIKISPPGKTNLASIDSYSGGEKSMIAIALLFSILRAKPTPFCILDEIDAALDETNIHRFANYVAGFKETQFTLVTHQRSTMEYADALFGVTMQEQGVTSVLSLLLGERETEEFAEKLN